MRAGEDSEPVSNPPYSAVSQGARSGLGHQLEQRSGGTHTGAVSGQGPSNYASAVRNHVYNSSGHASIGFIPSQQVPTKDGRIQAPLCSHPFRPTAQHVSQSATRPAYRAVGVSSTAASSAPAGTGVATTSQLNPQDWPVAVKNYVERCFKVCKPSQRPNLQQILKIVITDAQTKGELWTRKWDSLPIPNLTLKPTDAAAIVIRVAAVTQPLAVAKPTSRFDSRPPMPGESPARPAMQFGAPQQLAAYTPRPMRPNEIARAKPKIQQEPSMVRFGLNNDANNSRKRSFSVCQNSDSDSDASQGGPFGEDEEQRRLRRANRFKNEEQTLKGNKSGKGKGNKKNRSKLAAMLRNVGGDSERLNWDAFALKGTCTDLEKSYFRLTSAPDPSTVRPGPILRKALDRLIKLIALGEVNYFYAQDQFKGLRQDCVIQAIRGGLAAEIYESHARAALEYGDVAEYNQCQGQLRSLYADGIKSPHRAEAEFLAYRILYQSVHAHKGELVGLLHTLQQVGSPHFSKSPFITHALQVRRAIASHNYALFFKLYDSAPALGRALMDLAIRRLRFQALTYFVKAFKPTLSVAFVSRVLGFLRSDHVDSIGKKPHNKIGQKEATPLPGCSSCVFEGKNRGRTKLQDAMADCEVWLRECGASIIDGGSSEALLDCKSSMGKLQLPEEKDAVAHGDANLDIQDFLKGFSNNEDL